MVIRQKEAFKRGYNSITESDGTYRETSRGDGRYENYQIDNRTSIN